MSDPTLHDLCLTGKYNTDKYFEHVWHVHSYIENFYNKNFLPLKDTALNILEIGVWSGGSMLLWKDYFPNATVWGVDISTQHINVDFNQDRLKLIIGDAYSDNIINNLPDDYFDIIIDDGPHTLESMRVYIEKYIPKLKQEKGILVLEDIGSISWVEELLELVPERLKANTSIIDLSNIDNRSDSILLYIKT